MTSIQQREQLQSQIWKIANEVRGAVDGWDFKQFVLGTLFYRFISENFTDYIEGGDDSIDYASLPDNIYLLLLISSLRSIFNSSAILERVTKSGCETLVHHFDIVDGSLPNCSASHFPVFFFFYQNQLKSIYIFHANH